MHCTFQFINKISIVYNICTLKKLGNITLGRVHGNWGNSTLRRCEEIQVKREELGGEELGDVGGGGEVVPTGL